MRVLTAGKEASAGIERAARYTRHRPEQILLYQIVQTHTPAFLAELAKRERSLPDYVQREFEAYLACGRLEHGFLRVRCNDCQAERLVAFSCKRRGLLVRDTEHEFLRFAPSPGDPRRPTRSFDTLPNCAGATRWA